MFYEKIMNSDELKKIDKPMSITFLSVWLWKYYARDNGYRPYRQFHVIEGKKMANAWGPIVKVCDLGPNNTKIFEIVPRACTLDIVPTFCMVC